MRHVEHATDGSLAHDISYEFDDQGREIAKRDNAAFGMSEETTYTLDTSSEETSTFGEESSTTCTLPNFTIHTDTNTSQQFESASLSNETSEVATLEVAKRDGAGRILELATSLGDTLRSFDEAGRLASQSFEASAPQTYTYLDNSSKLSSWSVLGQSEAFAYAHDTGRLEESDEATYTYTQDSALPLRRLIKPSTPQYNFASEDTTQTFNAPPLQAPEPAVSDFAFNAKGQRIRSRISTQAAELAWSGERLISFETSDTQAEYTYDASGMRIKAHVTKGDVENELRYTYDDLRLLEVASSGTENYCIGYLYGNDNQTPTLASYETSGTSMAFRLESNVRGEVVALRDASGNVFARYTYSEYGVLKSIATTATDQISLALARDIAQRQPLRYAGYTYDDYSQMYYCAARYYDPATQVFVSLDPARADGERSGYLYCDGDPVNHADPSGEFAMVLAGTYVTVEGVATIAAYAAAVVYASWKVVSQLRAFSCALSSSLSRGKKPKSPKKNEWHHIVAKAAWRAASVRRVFSKVGLSVNNSQNLVKIKYGMHGRIHTKKYYALVNSIITGAYNSKIRVVSKEKKEKAALFIFKQYLITKSRFAKC